MTRRDLNKKYNSNTLITEIRRVISEELGIHEDIKDAFKKLKSAIISDSQGKRFFIDYHGNMSKCGVIPGYEVFNDVVISINYKIIYIENKNKIPEISCLYDGYGEIDMDDKVLYTMLFYCADDGKYYDDTTQHELDHAYKELFLDKRLLKKQLSKDIYQKACLGLDSEDNLTVLVSTVIYYNNAFERDAFANEIYSTITQNPYDDMFEVVSKTIPYKNVCYIKRFIEKMDEATRKKIDDIVFRTYGKHFNWWYNMAKNVVNQYIKRIGRTMAKAKKDLQGDNLVLY